MKSAYELAMERLEKEAPGAKLTDAKKQEIAEIDSTYRARIAEREVFLQDQLKKARAAGNSGDVESLQHQLSTDLRRLREECETRKNQARERP